MIEKSIQFIIGLLCGLLSYMYGDFDGMIKALLFCMAIDYITGIISAYKSKELSSKIGFLGLSKKFIMLFL